MNKGFIKIGVFVGVAVFCCLGLQGLFADTGDEFDLDLPQEFNVPRSENDFGEQVNDDLLPVPDLESPDEKKTEDSRAKLEDFPEVNDEDEGEHSILEDSEEMEKSEESKTSNVLEIEQETDLEIPLEVEDTSEPEIRTVSTEEMEDLRGKIQTILKTYQHIGLSTAENSPNDIIFYVMPYGCEAEIFLGHREDNTRINAIGALCWNIPMKDSVAFTGSTEKLMPRLGYGIQQYSGQLLAAMAIARVPIDYRFPAGGAKTSDSGTKKEPEMDVETNSPEIPKGKKNFEIRNLVEFEQKNCRWGRDLSLTLIGLSYYLEPDAEWEANDGEKWTLERIVKNELDRDAKLDDSSAVNQLLGLLCAIRCRKMKLGDEAITGEYKRADNFMESYKKFVLDLQNEIGVWHPKYFEMKGVTPNQPTEMLEASGHILRWLVAVTPKRELKDERIFKAVKIVAELLEYQLTYWDPGNASGKELEGVMAALHALAIYEKRAW
ncbi:MAG: hypothetical protein IJU53_10740 [Thermoguttaceae bacterium]|nr:hypothetical protein [Thermoguttaceae bacterium]